MASEDTINEEDVDEPIEEDEEEEGDVLDSDDVSFTATSKSVEVLEDFNIVSRQRIRDEIDEQVAAFLARGGKISEVPANVTADPPKKPSPDYGGRPI